MFSLKTIIVPKFIFRDGWESHTFYRITLLVDAASDITSDTFDQEKHEYWISGSELESMMDLLNTNIGL